MLVKENLNLRLEDECDFEEDIFIKILGFLPYSLKRDTPESFNVLFFFFILKHNTFISTEGGKASPDS